MNFIDNLTIDGTRKRTEDGALIVNARAARTGVQIYGGFEVGRPDLPTVRVFRSADEVFSKDTLASFAHRAVTNDHPNEAVTADNWKAVAVGHTSDEVAGEGIYVRVPLMVSDAAAIVAVESGKRELSAGYACDLDWTAGVTQSGEAFDAQQKNIRVNHVAIVQRGRAGKDCRIGDSASWGVSPIIVQDKEPKPMRTMIVDMIPINLEDANQTEAVIKALQTKLSDSASALATAAGTATATIALKDTKIGEMTAEIAQLKDAAPKPADLDKLVRDRAALVDLATKIAPTLKVENMADADIKKAIVAAKLGDEAVKDASADTITGMFTVISKDAAPLDPFRQVVMNRDGAGNVVNLNDRGQGKYETSLTERWKTAK